MGNDFSRDHLPREWSLARWDAARDEVRSAIWRQGLIGKPITYKALSEQLKSEQLFWRSEILRGLLNEIATDEAARGGPWVTAFVVLSGRKYAGEGLFKTVPEREWLSLGKTKFCEQQQHLAARWIADHPEADHSSS